MCARIEMVECVDGWLREENILQYLAADWERRYTLHYMRIL